MVDTAHSRGEAAGVPSLRRDGFLRPGRWMPIGLVLAFPAMLISISALIVPIALMMASRLNAPKGGIGIGTYVAVFSDPYYLRILAKTLRNAGIATGVALVIAWPVAFRIAYSGKRGKVVLTALVLAPLLVSAVVRTFGWIVLLGPGGPAAVALSFLRLDTSNRGILYSDTAVVIGLVHIFLPIMVASIFAGLNRLDESIFRAAVNLGASPLKAIVRVYFPASMPGVLAGAIIVFGLSASAYITPSVLGGATNIYMSTLIFQSNMVHLDFPFGAALALVLLVSTLIVVVIFKFVVERLLFRGVFQRESR